MPGLGHPKPRVTISVTVDLDDDWAEYYDMVGASPEQIGQRIAEDIVEKVFDDDETVIPCVQVWSPGAVALSQ